MRINCGGFELNENDFELDGETLSLKNSGGGSGTGSNILIANATWLLASNDPMREQYEEMVHEQSPGAIYHGRFILDKTWNEVKNAQSAMIKIQSNETDVDMDGSKLFFVHPLSVTLQINAVFFAEAAIAPANAYGVQCVSNENAYISILPSYDGCPIGSVFFRWGANNENDYLSSGPLFALPSV